MAKSLRKQREEKRLLKHGLIDYVNARRKRIARKKKSTKAVKNPFKPPVSWPVTYCDDLICKPNGKIS